MIFEDALLENMPVSASDKSVIDCLNNFLRSYRAIHLQGTQPCVSCSRHKEKGQALSLVEFLTAENATTALSLDGRSFSNSVPKFRRPKDFVNATGICIRCFIFHINGDEEPGISKEKTCKYLRYIVVTGYYSWSRFSDSCYFHEAWRRREINTSS